MSARNLESSVTTHPNSDTRTIGSEHYHGAMKKEHPDWNFCPTCNASLAEQVRSDVMSLLLTSAQSQLVMSAALTPTAGIGTLSPFSLRGDTKIPVWAEATQLGSPGLSKERLFEEVILQHVLPAFRNGFKLAKYSGPDEDVHLFLQILVKYAQRDLSDSALNIEKTLPSTEREVTPQNIEDFNALNEDSTNNFVVGASKKNRKSFTTYYSPKDDPTRIVMRSENFVSSGILGLDAILGGGIPKRKVTLLSGQSGSGKTIFAAQFLLEGYRRGEIGILALSGQMPQDVLQELDALGLGLYEAIQQKKLFLIVQDRRRVFRIRGIDVINVKDGSELLGVLSRLVSKKKASRLVVDSITPLVVESGKESTLAAAGPLFTTLSELECTTLLVSDLHHASRGASYLGAENYAAGVVVLRAASQHDRYLRYLFVPKMKCSNHSLRKYIFTIEKDIGIRVRQQMQTRIETGNANSNSSDGLGNSTLLSDLSNLVKLLARFSNGIPNYEPRAPPQVNDIVRSLGSPNEGEVQYQRNPFSFFSKEPLVSGTPPSPGANEIRPGYASNEPRRLSIKEAKLTKAANANPWSSIIMSRDDEDAKREANSPEEKEISPSSLKAPVEDSSECNEGACVS